MSLLAAGFHVRLDGQARPAKAFGDLADGGFFDPEAKRLGDLLPQNVGPPFQGQPLVGGMQQRGALVVGVLREAYEAALGQGVSGPLDDLSRMAEAAADLRHGGWGARADNRIENRHLYFRELKRPLDR